MRLNRVTNNPLVLCAVMLSTFLAAVEGTVVSTAMPAIVADLGNFSLYSWVFSSYLLMTTITVLIYGKLADLWGRKPIIIFGLSLFMVGSFLCGMADSMEMLILFRFIQGIGAGAVTPIATTIIGDIYPQEERGKVQGYLSSVWGISAVFGPILGGFLVQAYSWKYIFWLNIPLAFVAIIGFVLFFHENVKKEQQKIDFIGSLYLILSVSILMLLLVESGSSWGWLSWNTGVAILLFFIFLILFILRSRCVSNPIIPVNLWNTRTITVVNLISFLSGIILMGISGYLPTYVQGVMGKTPIIAGLTLTTMSIGWPIGSTVSGKIYFKIGYKKLVFTGSLALIAGSIVFILLSPDKSPLWPTMGSFLIGLGMGLLSTTIIIFIQNYVEWNQRGVATALNTFIRNLGNTIGVALIGGILNIYIKNYFERLDQANLTINSINQLLDPQFSGEVDNGTITVLQTGLSNGLHGVYLVIGLVAVINFLCFFLLLRIKETKTE